METKTTDLTIIRKDIERQLADPETAKALIETTFKGFTPENMKKAILEGTIRGYTFRDFLEKNIYAISYGNGYSLVTSVDDARKRGMKSGIVGVGKPEYSYKPDGTLEACTITVKRKIDANTIGEFTAEVFFNEYTTGKNLWVTKPRTMISKVAEMHALRKACPEELAQAYLEEEYQKPTAPEAAPFDPAPHLAEIDKASTLAELKKIWTDLPAEAKQNKEIVERKDEIKEKLTPEPEAPRQTEAVDPNA